MAGLAKLTTEERALIISIPYRVGVWVSNCDDNDKTRMDDKRESQTLELVISKMSKAHRKMPFAASVMSEVQGQRQIWDTWARSASEVEILSDVQKALELAHQKLSPKEAGQYKQAVWNIGIAVAQAFGEHIDPDNEMHLNRFFSWMGSFITSPPLKKAPENMSEAEKTALKKLRSVLKG